VQSAIWDEGASDAVFRTVVMPRWLALLMGLLFETDRREACESVS